MSFLWQTDFEKKTFYVEDRFFSPYMEIDNLRGSKLGVNPFLRFRNIFVPILEHFSSEEGTFSLNNIQDIERRRREREEIENVLFQYLARLDTVRGKHLISLQEDGIEKEIKEGRYGSFVKQIFAKLNDIERNTVKSYLLQHYKRNGKISFYREVVQAFFPGSVLYIHSADKKLLLYIPHNREKDKEEKLWMLDFLFLDAGQVTDVYWNEHFGILGRDWSMQLDTLVLY